MLKIGDFSKLSRISIRMLRYYDEIGLLVPENIDTFTSYRYYGEGQLPIANRITSLKNMGFSLDTIAKIFDNYNNSEALNRFLEVKKQEILEQTQEMQNRLQLLETAMKRLREDGMMMKYDVTLKQIPARNVASVRKNIPSYNQEGILWNMLMGETAPQHLQYDDPCYGLAIYHDEEYRESDVDVEVQMAVKGQYKNTENVIFKAVPEVEVASATFKGSYEKLNEVNEAVANWVRDSKYEFCGCMFNIYHVSPGMTKNPDDLVTEVCYPVRLKK